MTASLRRVASSVAVSLLPALAAVAQSPGRDAPALRGSIDDLQLQVAARAPAFGGLFVDEAKGTINVWSWNETALGAAEAEDAVRAVFGDQLPAGRIRILPGSYGFRELKTWHDRLLPLLATPGVVLTDIDDRRNRLTVGVADLAIAASVRQRLAALGVPGDAVDVVRRPPLRFLTSLLDRHRPLVGGLQVAFGLSLCTEGFNAVRAGVQGFVTNSHCTRIRGGIDSTRFYQPTVLSTNRVGIETVDPVYFTGAPCPAGMRCRRSDSAFVRRDTAVTTTLGRIARPALGSTAWSATDTFRIVRELDALVGQRVTKVGRTTGRTQGLVSATCANANPLGTDIVFLCQSFANTASGGGDSGSPVFRVTNKPAANDVWLSGILWGGDSAGTMIVFSPISGIQRTTAPAELGALHTCATGFTC